MKPRLVIRQKLTALVNKYTVHEAGANNEAGAVLALAQQKRIAMREKIVFYTDETRAKMSFTFRAEKVLDVHGRYFVEDPAGNLLGMFKKEFAASLTNSTWKILDVSGNELLTVKESNATVAALRRFIGFIPLVGDLGELVMLAVKYHFIFVDTSGNVVGTYRKTTLFRDTYCLCVDDAAWQQVDWRVFASIGVALDALQSR